jgi:2-oxoglutarate dehydrogenase E2 component (dihydrolipoamide succinyltransferase)
MAEKPILMPKMGESIAEATVIRWLKNVGEKVEKDEPLVEIATDKVDSEIPSTEAGILVKQLYKDGDVVKVGEAVAYIDADASAGVTTQTTPTPVVAETIASPVAIAQTIENEISQLTQNHVTQIVNADGGRFYSPLVLNIARAEGISMAVLETIPGTGKDGRVTKSDILNFVNNPSAPVQSAPAPVATITPVAQPIVEAVTAAPKVESKPAFPSFAV